MIKLLIKFQELVNSIANWDFLITVPLRIYLAAVFWTAGLNKLYGFSDVVEWFGNSDWGLGLPFPMLMASLATGAEVGGAILLLLGLATRWISIPLMSTMVVAAVSVHWKNGWQAVYDSMSPWANPNTSEALSRLAEAKNILMEHGNYGYLTEHGHLVVSNNGIEWAATYFLMVGALFIIGGGRYFSLDYWIKQKYMPENKINTHI